MAVLDKNMDDISKMDDKAALATVQSYISYMIEMLEYNDAQVKKRLDALENK